MKKIHLNLGMVLAFVAALALASCGGNAENATEDQTSTEQVEESQDGHDHEGHDHEGHDHEGHDHGEEDKTGPEWTSTYICPMHCEGSGSEEPGKCPVCGMDYVLNEDAGEEEGDEG